MPSSPDSSSDSSVGSPHNQYEGPNVEAESCLPGVVSERSKAFLAHNRKQNIFKKYIYKMPNFDNSFVKHIVNNVHLAN